MFSECVYTSAPQPEDMFSECMYTSAPQPEDMFSVILPQKVYARRSVFKTISWIQKDMRPKRITPEEVAAGYIKSKEDPPNYRIEIIPPKGRGVRTTVKRRKHDFILCYHGEYITQKMGEEREDSQESVFRYFFSYQGKDWCIDATVEPSTGQSLGRLVNHARGKDQNCLMKIVTVNSRPHLCLFASRDIHEEEELLYDYGVDNLPWEIHSQQQKQTDSFDNSPDECSKKIFEPQIEKQKSSVTSKNNTVDSSEPATVTDDTFLLQKSNSTERWEGSHVSKRKWCFENNSFDNSPDECSKKIFEPQIKKQKSSVTSKNNTVDSSEPATVTDDTFLLQKSNSIESEQTVEDNITPDIDGEGNRVSKRKWCFEN
ncbi:hypothetical protein ScPMuIL_005227, partial [Solemya velum]